MPQTFSVGCRSWIVNATAWLFIVLALGAGALVLLRAAALVQTPAWLLIAALALLPTLLAAAVGLLRRLPWALPVAICVLALAIAANLAWPWLQQEDGRWFAVGAALCISAPLAWAIRRLTAYAVRQEFAWSRLSRV